MADNTINCRLVTPSKQLLNEQVTYASVPAWDGLIGFQHGGSPMVSRLGLGKLRLDFPPDQGSGSREYLVEGGFLEMGHNELVILAEMAIPAEELLESEAKAELAEAEARVVPDDAPDKLAAVERITRAKERAKLKLAMAQNSRTVGI
ncbi:MAG: F0F1 ATP synthase subunit epsilon [Phycisphaerales bacterium]